MNLHASRELSDDVIAVLVAGGLTVGDAVAPGSVPAGDGYVVVYPLGGSTGGTIEHPDDDGFVIYQTTSIGPSRRHAEWVADRVRAVMLASTGWTLTGRTVTRVTIDALGAGGRDDNTAEPSRFSVMDQFAIWTSPT